MFASARRLLSVGVPAAAASVLASNRASCDESRLAALERRVAALEQPARANSRSDGVASSWAKAVLSPDVLFSERDLETMIDSLAAQITRDYGDEESSSSSASSTASSCTVSSGNVKIKKDSSFPLAGKHVLIVDEMCDSGRTMASLKELMKQRQVKSVKTCFVVGYGMDWGGKYRSLPFVGVVRKELYS
ncbi:guanine phosphoribosyltransferase [Aureococcus anophagefferens]|nr:guanine phosphoribosyltransferase [Aureococcus anophagefferens]